MEGRGGGRGQGGRHGEGFGGSVGVALVDTLCKGSLGAISRVLVDVLVLPGDELALGVGGGEGERRELDGVLQHACTENNSVD